jgi:radical SAM superfamily enzyme YgiQ (UPF0313 family)
MGVVGFVNVAAFASKGAQQYTGSVRVLLVSTYDLGRQPFGLASPAAWLRRAGVDVASVDAAKARLTDDAIAAASLVAFYLPMHTATRLALPLVARARRVNPEARIAAYGLYAQLNAPFLRERGVDHVLGPEAERDLVTLALADPTATNDPDDPNAPNAVPRRLEFVAPDRGGLPPLDRYATLQMPDGTRRIAGSTEATRGCKHLCRHCPIVPVYKGRFRAIPVDVVMEDVGAQVAAGAQHITFGDPDFFNGPSHARRIVERLAAAHPGVTYDATIKVEHLLTHADLLPLLRDTGCLFVTSAVESLDDRVLARLEKGHTRADVFRVVEVCRAAGLTLAPTFVPFTPWTGLDEYRDLLDTVAALGLVEQIAPVQYAIRLLVTAGSPLLELEEIRAAVEPFDPGSLTWPWKHGDPRVDRLQEDVMRIAGVRLRGSRADAFAAILDAARAASGLPATPSPRPARDRATVPYLNEPWYC